MGKISSVFLIFTVFLVAELLVSCSGEEANATFGCILRERSALLRFKASLSDPSDRLSSWNATTDCCEWQGITCDETSGHVIGLDLQNQRYEYVYVDGEYSSSPTFMLHAETLNSSILELKHLSFLDLSGNDFHLTSIPSFLGSMGQMQHLNLASANFSGVVPHHIGNLSLLSVLDLSYNQLDVDDFTWVSHLSSLKHLNMSSVDLSPTNNLLKVLNMLPFLIDLRMSWSKLENRNLQHACVNSTLPHIEYLDLSSNNFHGNLPCFLENMTSLRYLLLSVNKYTSCHQTHLFKLTNLVQLILGYNSLQCSADSISEFILDKPHLEYLSLENNSCSGDVSKILLNLSRYPNPKLKYLDLSINNFYGQLPEEIGRIRTLQYLYLSSNNISNSIPSSIGNLRALKLLDLYYNRLTGLIPSSLGNLSALKSLDLTRNHLSGLIPSSLGYLSALYYLSLGDNLLSGLIPSSLRNLSSLEGLSLYNNQLNGEIPVSFFDSLSKLQYLEIDGNSLKFVARSDWVPPFQLKTLDMRSCEIGGVFPQWIQTQKELSSLSLRNCSISGEIPESLCEMKSLVELILDGNSLSGSLPECVGNLNMLKVLALSSNRLSGLIPSSLRNLSSLEGLSLSNNQLNGEIPVSFFDSLSKLQYLNLGTNSLKFVARSDWVPPFQLGSLLMGSLEIGGVFPQWIQTQKELEYLSLPNCSISGEIPESLCEIKSLGALFLDGNSLSGSLPECVGNLNMLQVLSLSSNRLSGVIPNSIGRAYSLVWLKLSENRFSGELPYDIRNCTQLEVLDIGENAISGKVPKWMGNYLVNLRVLRLRSNELYDTIPSNLCQLSEIQVLDLGINSLTGNIPHCIHNFTRMVFKNSSIDSLEVYDGDLRLMIKGLELDYSSNLRYVVYMDLSSNNLVGEIPLELTSLTALHFLNLSHNHLQGYIPRQIGDMNLLESLDLSNNNLSGNIPQGLSKLTSMSYLNLSHNKLTGEIPTGNQLQTLVDPSIYEGNPGLCGAPLPKTCHEEKTSPNLYNPDVEGEEDKTDRIWLYGIVISGFATGFWGAIGVLVFKIRWRHVYFRFTDEIIARIFGA